MNLSPSTLLVIFVVTTLANVVILLAASARSRSVRARRLVEVDGLLSSSYLGSGSSDVWPKAGDDGHGPVDGWPGSPGLGRTDASSADDVQPPTVEHAPTVDQAPIVEQAPTVEPEDEVGADDVQAHQVQEDQIPDVEVPAADILRSIPTVREIAVPRGRDALTGLLNATAFEDAMSHEDAREQRYGRPATVVVFELDGLAKLVDRLGSDPGDRIETALGDSIVRLARRADYVARLERGRYAVLLPETDEVAAINYVERIRRACDLWLESGAIAMRLAIGWASTGGDAGLTGAIRTATERMRLEQRRNARLASDVDELIEDEAAIGL
jgi:diguanylate cyclase (GGDEF)-like protein